MKREREKWVVYAWGAIFATILFLSINSCCAQIPTQYYFANDSCEFYLPDYSQAVEVRDNCCVDSMGFYQTPHSGTKLFAGHDVTVTLHGADCSGNKISMQFDVIVIDTVPPTFFYDSTQFLPVGQYQNEERIFKLYFTQDTTVEDDFGNNPITQYYRDEKGHQPIATNIFDDTFSVSHLDHPDDWRAQIFVAEGNFHLTQIRLKLYRTGYDPYQDVIVEIMEIGGDQNPVGSALSQGKKRSRELYTDPDGAWYTIPMRKTTLYHGQSYAIVTRLSRADAEAKVEWRINEGGYSQGFAIWTNNGANETGLWQRNWNVDRMFEIWGKPI